MNIYKFGVLTGLAAGAAFALAPLASAAPVDSGDSGFDMGSTLSSEIASMNSMFELLASLSGVDAGDIIKSDGAFDTIASDDVNATFASLLYGFNPADNAASDPGSYVLYNGALTQFYDAYNVGLYALMNDGDLIDSSDLFGSQASIDAALATAGDDDNAWNVVDAFLTNGFNDVTGYFDFSGLLDMPDMSA